MTNSNLRHSGSHISCIWLDATVYDTEDSKTMMRKLCDIFGNCNVADNINKGHQIIKHSTAGSKLVLVVSGQLGSELVPLVHADARVCAIYVYCGNIERNRVWSDGYTKVRFFVMLCLFIITLFIQVKLVTNNPNALIDKINTDKPNL
jgi:hypothetical protein